jgi:glycosyltransferase involved in cell wall biosynthesis
MKILVFTTLYPNNIWPNQGVFIKERMTQFASLDGCEVKVVAPVPYFPPIKANWRWRFSQVVSSEVRDGIAVYHPRYFMTPKWGMPFYGLLMFLSVLRTVKRLRNEFAFDLIDAHFVYPDGFAAVLLGKYFNKPVVVSARGSDVNVYSAFPIIRRLLRYTLNEAKTVIAVSRALRDAITRLGIPGDKVSVVPNGVDVQKFYPLKKQSARRALGLPEKRILLSVGNLTANKGLDLLLKAFSRLSNNPAEGDLYLVIIGDGVMRRQIEALILSLGLVGKVRLEGAVAHETLNLWYNAADLFCLLSQKEGWPNVLLESLACGLPVVATTVGGIPEIIRSETIGVLTERDEAKIEDSIRRALAKPWRVDELSTYAKNFSWDRAAVRLQEIFRAALMAGDAHADGAALDQQADNHAASQSDAQVGALSETQRINLP